jgi:hypothetical protein
MANPIEDQIYEYVKAHRPLKLFLLATTFVGIISSAFGVVRPILDELKPMAIKALGLKAPQSTYIRYGCIVSRVASSTKLIEEFESLEKQNFIESARPFLLETINRFEYCQTLLGTPQFMPIAESALNATTVRDLIAQVQPLLTRNDELLAAHLARSNIKEYNLLQFLSYLHESTSFSKSLLESNASTESKARALPILRSRAKSANDSYRRFAELSEHKVPAIEVETGGLEEISSSSFSALKTFNEFVSNAP